MDDHPGAALAWLEDLADKINSELDEGEVVVTEVIDNPTATAPEELLLRFRDTRDRLIRTRVAGCVDVARELDKVISALEHADYSMMSQYDYGRFTSIMDRILNG